MARKESVALGGYYPIPADVLPRIAPLLEPYLSREAEVSFMDPCAGEGEAIIALMNAWVKNIQSTVVKLFTCEMEASRYGKLRSSLTAISHALSTQCQYADAFTLTMERDDKDGISVLLLNPPYDFDRVHGRLEHKFLTRFAPALMDGGVLLFVVPFYALKASAEYLAQEFTDLRCFKFPAAHFEAYKQVVLFARKRDALHAPDARVQHRVREWAKSVEDVPELPNIASPALCQVPTSRQYYGGLSKWVARPVDVTALLPKIRPWEFSNRSGEYVPVHGILPDLPIQELLLRTYPVATPPRPAHIAAGIASGIFNGSRVEPSDPSTGLPSLLVKGVFDQEYRTVEEKLNKHGEVKAIVQVQQPKLVATVLDLRTHKYHTLSAGEASDKPSIEGLTVAGLLRYYGDSLMAVMEKQCPILYDPRKDGPSITLAQTERTLYTAQSHVAKAIVKLLGGPGLTKRQRRGKSAILLGEIGSGKTSVALAVAHTIGATRPLVLCPPHLLTSWRNEIAAVLPQADVRVLSSVSDIEAVAKDSSDRVIVSLLSRETAKLSHGWEGVGSVCPRCGNSTPSGDLAKKRARCEAQTIQGTGTIARLVQKLANQLVRFAPRDGTVYTLLSDRFGQKRIEHFAKKCEEQEPTFPGFINTYFDEVLEVLIGAYEQNPERVGKTIPWLLLSLGDNDLIEKIVRRFAESVSYRSQDMARQLLVMLPPNSPQQLALAAEFKAKESYSSWSSWAHFSRLVTDAEAGQYHSRVGGIQLSWKSGTLELNEVQPRTVRAAQEALHALYSLAGFRRSEPCGEFLFQAIPEPRRIALAQHIMRYYPNIFDFLVLDEAHEYSTEGSAQERSAHRLTNLGLPTILMTGTIMNGYAESLFMNMWAISPDFRREFDREDKQRFIERFGYRKRLVEDRENGEIVAFGTMSDRVTRSERVIGNAPGVLPLFLLRHLLPIAVTLHKADLALDLPPCTQIRHLVEPDPDLRDRYVELQAALVRQIKKDQFDETLAGKLFGQLAELPSYLDRSTEDTGNNANGDFKIEYPESVGGNLVAEQPGFPRSRVSTKEAWLLEIIEKELAEGRNVMVFTWHTNLLPRLSRLISERIDGKAPILYADKVPTAKRQDWIDREIVRKKARVMVTNPVAIQTGLNNLVHFATEIWVENPACNPIVFRQATGRVDRIGQILETRIYFPVYVGTLQYQLYDLLLKKVAVSVSTDGLDPESALLAAGVGDAEYMTGLSIGKQLWSLLSNGVLTEEAAPVYKPAVQTRPKDLIEMMASVDLD